jgi:hypothetical protein
VSSSIPSARYTDKADGINGNACFCEQAVKRILWCGNEKSGGAPPDFFND